MDELLAPCGPTPPRHQGGGGGDGGADGVRPCAGVVQGVCQGGQASSSLYMGLLEWREVAEGLEGGMGPPAGVGVSWGAGGVGGLSRRGGEPHPVPLFGTHFPRRSPGRGTRGASPSTRAGCAGLPPDGCRRPGISTSVVFPPTLFPVSSDVWVALRVSRGVLECVSRGRPDWVRYLCDAHPSS